MCTREEAINDLNSLFIIGSEESDVLKTESISSRSLSLKYVAGECQVFEIEEKDGVNVLVGNHVHEFSKEIFYQIRGETKFLDGDILKSGDLKVINPKIPHSFVMGKYSAIVLIVHPVEKLLFGGDNGQREKT